MASSPMRAPAAGQQQSRLLEMQKKFQQKHLATLAAVKGTSPTSQTLPTTTTVITTIGNEQPVAPVRRQVGAGVGVQQQQHRLAGSGSGTGSGDDPADSMLQVDVKGKVRQLFAERNQNVQRPGMKQQRRQRRRSLTGRDRSRPLRPLSGANNDPLCKTVCFTAPSAADGADFVGVNGADGNVRGELLALFGRLPNLGGRLLSESFQGNKMKTAQSAPELKWLLDGGGSSVGNGGGVPGQQAAGPPARGGGKGPGNRLAETMAGRETLVAPANGDETVIDDYDDYDDQQQSPQHPATRINSKTATLVKKPLAAVNGNGPRAGFGRGAAAAKRTGNNAAANTAAANANAGKAFGTLNNSNSRLLLPPVVQSTVINALATGATGSAALASAATAAASGPQRPLVRAAAKVSSSSTAPGGQQRQKPSGAVSPHRWVPQSKAAVSKRPTVPPRRAAPAAAPVAAPRVQSAKSQLSADRGPPADGMARCPLCARDFAADRLPKHEEVCRRTRERDRKRKVFDASRKRLEAVAAEAGVDVASFKKKGQKEDQRAAEKLQKKKDAWRRKHDQLVRNVRNARAVQRHLAAGGTVRDLPPELENTADDRDDEADSDLVKCPHCGRTFNETAADRHVPLCADRQRNAAARMQNKRR